MERSQPQITCAICKRPVDLQVDKNTDEQGKAVHQDCYTNSVAKTGRRTTSSN